MIFLSPPQPALCDASGLVSDDAQSAIRTEP